MSIYSTSSSDKNPWRFTRLTWFNRSSSNSTCLKSCTTSSHKLGGPQHGENENACCLHCCKTSRACSIVIEPHQLVTTFLTSGGLQIMETSEFKVKLNFIEYSITGRLNCHLVFSNLQNCVVTHRFSYYNEPRMHIATKAIIRCIK